MIRKYQVSLKKLPTFDSTGTKAFYLIFNIYFILNATQSSLDFKTKIVAIFGKSREINHFQVEHSKF